MPPSVNSPLALRVKYGCLLILSFIISCIMRSDACLTAGPYMKFGYNDGCNGEAQCLKDQPAYRISFATVLFFAIHWIMSHKYNLCMSSATTRVKFNTDWFLIKIALLLGLMVVSLYIPSNPFFTVFAWFALVFSVVYLILQLVIFLGFSYDLNDWLRNHEGGAAKIVLIGATILMFLSTLVGTGFMYYWFGDDKSCVEGQMMITLTLLSAVLYTILGIFAPNGSLFPSAIVFLYTMWTIFTSLTSGFPDHGTCNRLASEPTSWKLGISAAMSGLSLAYACTAGGASRENFTGASNQMSDIGGDNLASAEGGVTTQSQAYEAGASEEEDKTFANHLSWFHLLMCLGSFYMSMLVTNWYITKGDGSSASSSDVSEVDTGTTSMWTKFASALLCILLYFWTLIAPMIFSDRDFS
eukprot:GILI01005935.1.p1 GENE.GILI01005935.1~~GILI01005935.1.p1  ORF type:complete len:412 (-),score=47.10 GILI01005935.1:118-1353(-)